MKIGVFLADAFQDSECFLPKFEIESVGVQTEVISLASMPVAIYSYFSRIGTLDVHKISDTDPSDYVGRCPRSGGPKSPAIIPTTVVPLRPPPAADGGHRKRAGVMVRPHVDEALVAPYVVDAVGIRARHLRTREIVALHAQGLLRRTPLLAGVCVVADQFLLLGVDRQDREPGRQGPLDAGVDMDDLSCDYSNDHD
jgi:hypothetical protein